MTIYRFPMPTLMTPMIPTVLHRPARQGADAPQRSSIREDVERVMHAAPGLFGTQEWMTADARENPTGFTIELDLPGIAPETIDVLAEDGVLLVRASREARTLSEGERQVIGERLFGNVERRFRLPKSADLSEIRADYLHGVLTVQIAKVAPAQPRRVTVGVGSSVATTPTAVDAAQ
jgi:HSP20 family protein